MKMSRYVIGMDIGGTYYRIGAVAGDYTIIGVSCGESSVFTESADPVGELCRIIDGMRSGIAGLLCGICIGFPGTVSRDKSTVLSCPNLTAFDGVNVAEQLRQRYGAPVYVEHDVVLLLENDIEQLELRDRDCVVGIYVGTGLGNALYIHGRILEGKNANSGELGHIPSFLSDEPCPCGNRGCIELVASGKRLQRIRDELFPEYATLDEMMQYRSAYPEVREYIRRLAYPIAIEVNILDPDVVLLGGGVIQMQHLPYEQLISDVVSLARKPLPANDLNIVRLGEDPERGIRGAAIRCWRRIGQAKQKGCEAS